MKLTGLAMARTVAAEKLTVVESRAKFGQLSSARPYDRGQILMRDRIVALARHEADLAVQAGQHARAATLRDFAAKVKDLMPAAKQPHKVSAA